MQLDDGRPLPMPAMATVREQLRLYGDSYKAKFCPRIRWTTEDPVVTGSTALQQNSSAYLSELGLAPSLSLLPPTTTAGTLNQHHLGDDGAFRLALVPQSSPLLGAGYLELVHRIAANVSGEIDNRMRSGASPEQHADEGTEQIIPHISSPESKSLLARNRRELRRRQADIHALLQQHIEPYLAQHVMNGRRAELMAFRISRNMVSPGETKRLRATTWHWDTGPANPAKVMKVILYLSDVDTRGGCMLALRHSHSGAAFKMDGQKIWGPLAAPASVPREWLAEMFRDGYRPECLSGAAGSLVIFDTNIVHRGSRPATGRHRDAINFEFTMSHQRLGADELRRLRGKRLRSEPPSSLPAYPASLSSSSLFSNGAFPVDALLPQLKESTRLLPAVGFGTSNRKTAKGEPLVKSLVDFFQLGGRHVDSAAMYRNGAEIREALGRSRIPRDEVWITSKLNTIRHLARLGGFVNTSFGVTGALAAITQEVGTHVDLLLIHDPNELTSSERIDVWRGMLAARSNGAYPHFPHVGVSNFDKAQIEELEVATGVLPAVNEIEFHPWVSEATLSIAKWCISKGIAVVAYNSLGGKKNQARGKVVSELAAKHRVSNAQVLLRWALQRGVRVIPGATSRAHIQQNLNVSCLQLSEDEMQLLQGSSKPRTFTKYASGVNG